MVGEYVPWLSTGYAFNEDATRLSMTLREGVKWSDGAEFDAGDVQFTFELLRDTPGLDGRGLWTDLERIEVEGNTVHFGFKQPCFSGLERIAHQAIVPEHIWKERENPGTYPNPNPVGTGPFTEVTHFTSQSWRLEKILITGKSWAFKEWSSQRCLPTNRRHWHSYKVKWTGQETSCRRLTAFL